MTGIVSGLFIYPIKSCGGIALERAAVEARGLRHDRRWMIVGPGGMFVTQRTEPRLALVRVRIEGATLVVDAPGLGALRLPLAGPAEATEPEAAEGPDASKTSTRRKVRVWRDEVDAVDAAEEAGAWLTAWLGAPHALVFMPDDVRRAVKPAYSRPGDIVGFADGFPLLVASTSSLDDLNARAAAPVPMDRFRANVVVDGFPAWDEDRWTRIDAGAIAIRVVKPCDRCVVTATDQATGVRGVEPLRTLATFRRKVNDVFFAQNAIADTLGTLAVGDPVTVVERRDVPSV